MAGNSKNVFGKLLQPCSMNPKTGFFRDGCCKTGENDYGSHTVCVRVTEAFLLFSSKEGNDLSTPRPVTISWAQGWGPMVCLRRRWKEAAEAGCAPPVLLDATNEKALDVVSLADLEYHALVVE